MTEETELVKLVKAARETLQQSLSRVEAIHSRDIEWLPRRQDGTQVPHRQRLGSRKFTRQMAEYLDKPPALLQELRRRKYQRAHPRTHNAQRGCGCVPRLAYRLTWNVVGNRTTIEEAARLEGVNTNLATRVVLGELKAIESQLGRFH